VSANIGYFSVPAKYSAKNAMQKFIK